MLAAMARVFASLAFVTLLLCGVQVTRGLSLISPHTVHFAASSSSSPASVGAPPTEDDVLNALSYVSASLRIAEDAVDSANSTSYSMADNALQAMAEFKNMLGTLATAAWPGRRQALTEDQANEATRLTDTVVESVATAEANVSAKIDTFSSNISAILPVLNAVGKQLATQFLEALTMVEDLHNVSQSVESFVTRQTAKRAARKAVRALKNLNGDAADTEDATEDEPPQQVGVLKRLVDKFGWESAKRVMRRAVSKVKGEEDVDDEDPEAISLMAVSGLASDDNSNATEEMEARSLFDGHVLADWGVDSPEDLEAALWRKGPLDIDRRDSCARATQKVFHANKTLHKLSRKLRWAKTTIHRASLPPVAAGVAAMDSINRTAYSSLAEVSDLLERPVSRGLRRLAKVRFHMGRFAQEKALFMDAVTTLEKTTPLANTLQVAIDETCLSGACGETARKACEASALQAPFVPSSSPLPEDAPPVAASSSIPVDAPPKEEDVMDALANVDESLSTMEDAIDSANSTAFSMADNALSAIAQLQNVVGSLATAPAGDRQASLTMDQATQATRLIDNVGRSVATAKANVSTKMDDFSNNLTVIRPQLYVIGKQITAQFLQALTMVEDIYNVSQSEESLYARQTAKRAARRAARELRALSDEVADADHDDEPPEQVGVLRRLIDKFGWDAAKRILRRAASKLHGDGDDDSGDEESPKAINLMVDDGGLASDDTANSTAEELEARSVLQNHVLAHLDVDSPEDLEAALLRKGPLDIDRDDACAQATQKIYHANKTVHKLSRKFSFVKTTVHRASVHSKEAGVAAIQSVSTVYSSLAELSVIHEYSASREFRELQKVRFHMGQFARHKSLVLDAISTLAKTTPLADTLRSDVDHACLSGACGEKARRACEASAA